MPAINSPNSHGTMSSAHSETPTMDVDYTPAFRGFLVDVAGNIVVRLADDSSNITLTVLAGVLYPLQVKRFVTTSTTATGIHAFA